jgi:hypothetical protein
MSTIEVTPDELGEAAAQLALIAADLRHASSRVAGLAEHRLGARNVERALAHFAEQWSYGMRRMVASVLWTGSALHCAATSYEHTESGVTASLSGGASPGPG